MTRREVLRRRGVLPTSGADPGEVRGLVLLELKGMNRGLPGSCAHGLWMDGLTVPWFSGSQVPRLSRQGPTEVKVSIWDPRRTVRGHGVQCWVHFSGEGVPCQT